MPGTPDITIETLFNILPCHIYWKDLNGVMRGCNKQQALSLGFRDVNKIIGKTDLEFLAEKEAKQIITNDQTVIRTKKIQAFQEQQTLKDGKLSTYLSYKLPLFIDSKVIGIAGISFDISEISQKNDLLIEQLETAELTLDSILSNMPEHVYWLDKDNKFLGCNMNQARSFHLNSPDEIIGTTVYDYENKDDADRIIEANNKVLSTGETLTVEEPFTLQDGTIKHFISKKMPLKSKNGLIIGTLGISFDISSQKEAEKLKEQKQILEKQVESLELMSNTLAHELRTPLSTITTVTRIMKDMVNRDLDDMDDLEELKDDMNKMLTSITKQTSHSQTFINIILENAKDIENMNLFPIDIVPPIQSAIDDFPYSVEKHKDLVHFNPGDKPYTIKGDDHLLKHVILNLMKNSLFFIQKNKKGEINITLDEDDKNIILTFEDTAEGVDEENMPNLFENYYTKTGVGTGIGLGFCKRVVNAFSGTIHCESVKGEFIRFVMTFPKI